ncbi:Ubiquinone biosynthesis O-methyltransferase, mitochondrial [subsurface metagenome]|jgi:2-polyprenyl-3-methyl-5-hydroxy-6-metoxy-1,4-benzoquinol methylase
MKFHIANVIIYGLAKYLKQLSPSQCAEVLTKLVNLIIKNTSPKNTLQILFELENRLYPLEGRTSIEYGNGIHTKHRYINYHKFFIKNLDPGESVLDIGCGNGFMDYNIANQVHNVKIVGIDLNKKNIEFARERYRQLNLSFIEGNTLKELPNEIFDAIILSNVLEHIEQRVEFLRKILLSIKPKCSIIRVPLFERD